MRGRGVAEKYSEAPFMKRTPYLIFLWLLVSVLSWERAWRGAGMSLAENTASLFLVKKENFILEPA